MDLVIERLVRGDAALLAEIRTHGTYIPQLAVLVNDSDSEVAKAAMRTLRVVANRSIPDVVPTLLDAMCRAELQDDAALTISLAVPYQGCLPALEAALGSHDPTRRRHAAIVLGTYVDAKDDSGILRRLCDVLDGDDPVAQLYACQAVYRMGPVSRAALPSLQRLAERASGEVKSKAEVAIGLIRSGWLPGFSGVTGRRR